MGRIRTIKPEFPQSESIGRLSRDARLLFIQLWTIVDDSGKSRAASRMLASLLYPYDEDAANLIGGWLDELDTAGMIARYQVDGDCYLEITNWLKHQKIDRPSKSRFPDFDEYSRVFVEGSTTDLGPRTSTKDLGPKKEPSLCSGSTKIARETNSDWPKDYREQFWNTYPRKQSKKAAFKSLDRLHKTGEVTFAKLIAGIGKIPTNEPTFIPHPATWLNRGGWDDEIVKPNGGPNGHRPNGGARQSGSADFFAGLAAVAANISGDGPAPRDSDAPVPFGRVNIDG